MIFRKLSLTCLALGALTFNTKIHEIFINETVDSFLSHDARPEKTVYITFDDGPSLYTAQLLDILKEYNTPAIFFILGQSIELFPHTDELINNILEEGHFIGMHTMTHNRERLYRQKDSPNIFVNEMMELRKVISEMTNGYETNLCRAPYGKKKNFSAKHHKIVEDTGLYCVDWNVDSLDWSGKSSDEVYQQILNEMEKGKYPEEVILLFHEKQVTVEVLPQVIEYFRDLGYVFMSYSEREVFKTLN